MRGLPVSIHETSHTIGHSKMTHLGLYITAVFQRRPPKCIKSVTGFLKVALGNHGGGHTGAIPNPPPPLPKTKGQNSPNKTISAKKLRTGRNV